MTNAEKLLKRLEALQRDEGKPVLVSLMVLIGDDGKPAGWTLKEYDRFEGMKVISKEE